MTWVATEQTKGENGATEQGEQLTQLGCGGGSVWKAFQTVGVWLLSPYAYAYMSCGRVCFCLYSFHCFFLEWFARGVRGKPSIQFQIETDSPHLRQGPIMVDLSRTTSMTHTESCKLVELCLSMRLLLVCRVPVTQSGQVAICVLWLCGETLFVVT